VGKRVSADRPRETTLDSPTAQRILEAAERVLTDQGYSRLTLQAIEQESGEYRALVAYYFGNKQGLVQAVVDSLMSEGDAALRARLEEVADSADRVLALLETQREISADWRGFRAFFELLPHIMRDDEMRARLVESYRSSRELDGQFLESVSDVLGPPDSDRLAALSVAIVEGLAVQFAADPEHFDHEGTYRLWQSMVLHLLEAGGGLRS
jgi:AcrR family transcriptional regulator